ncbi:unnamed protein product [Lepeophtheirus salmonis]|uniref:(salmon louse) hypothetical protein n=1 Tax=Lepeophtheirus salmonis TaxID=72036 RepID=A0A7R8CT28_LEPSM|nr:unnamed protein product [Lepeophtheirus salmonis]CAF2922631.1 unnamed protein product [Lepeophtheirus salmonis]
MSDKDGSITLGIPLIGVSDYVAKLSAKVTKLDFEANKTTRIKLTLSKHDVILTHLSNDTIRRDAHRLTIHEKLIGDKKVKFNSQQIRQGQFDSQAEMVKSPVVVFQKNLLEDTILPKNNLVDNSVQAWFGISGDITGHAVKSLDGLVGLSTGCGEAKQYEYGSHDHTYGTDPHLEDSATDNNKVYLLLLENLSTIEEHQSCSG